MDKKDDTPKRTMSLLKQQTLDMINKFAKLTEQYLNVVVGEASFGNEDTAGQHIFKELAQVDKILDQDIKELNLMCSQVYQSSQLSAKIDTIDKHIKDTVRPYEELEQEMNLVLYHIKNDRSIEFTSKWNDFISSINDIVPWAIQLGKVTYAPPFEHELPRWFGPPVPQEDTMRSSLLYQQQTGTYIPRLEHVELVTKPKSQIQQPSRAMFSTTTATHLLGEEEDWILEDSSS